MTPKKDCAERVTCPVPPHSLHVIFAEPVSAPEPLQVSHAASFVTVTFLRAPATTSCRSIVISISRSAPRSSRAERAPPLPPPPKKLSKISAKFPASPPLKPRPEERRVGKEGRSRGAADH